MMIQEFIERTKYKPTYEEYHYIEESYYEFDGFKDEFCKQWLKDKKSGKWEMELKFRKLLDKQKAEYEAKIAEQEENLEFYRKYHTEYSDRAKKAEEKLEKINKRIIAMTEIMNDER